MPQNKWISTTVESKSQRNNAVNSCFVDSFTRALPLRQLYVNIAQCTVNVEAVMQKTIAGDGAMGDAVDMVALLDSHVCVTDDCGCGRVACHQRRCQCPANNIMYTRNIEDACCPSCERPFVYT